MGEKWCAMDLITIPDNAHISVSANTTSLRIVEGTCERVAFEINLNEPGFGESIELDFSNTSELQIQGNQTVVLEKNQTQTSVEINFCSLDVNPLSEVTIIKATASVKENVYFNDSTYVEFIPYAPAEITITSPLDNSSIPWAQTSMRISGQINSSYNSGMTYLIVTLNQIDLDKSLNSISTSISLGEAINISTEYQMDFDRLFDISRYIDEDTLSIRVYVQQCDTLQCTEQILEVKRIPDRDGDGIGDEEDVFPDDFQEWLDSDNDGVGDNADAYPYNNSESKDTDGDTYGDNIDEFPFDGSEWLDTDGDGYGDNQDAFPYDSLEHSDTDGDGVGDITDAYPTDPTKWKRESESDSTWERVKQDIQSGDLLELADEPVIVTFALSAIILAFLGILQTNLIAQLLPESLRMVGMVRKRRRHKENDAMWYDQLNSMCQLLKEEPDSLKEWIQEERLNVIGESIHSDLSNTIIQKRKDVLDILFNLPDEQLAVAWRNQSLFGKSSDPNMSNEAAIDLIFHSNTPVKELEQQNLSVQVAEVEPIRHSPKNQPPPESIGQPDGNGYEWFYATDGLIWYRQEGTVTEWTLYQK